MVKGTMSDEKRGSELDRLVENIVTVMEAEDSKVYTKEVIAEFRDPANIGPIDGADGTGIADGLCMDTMQIWVKLDGDAIACCTFYTDGCGATIACGSRLTKMATGSSIEGAMGLMPEDLISSLGGLPEEHMHCASLSVIALRNALRNALDKRMGIKEGRP